MKKYMLKVMVILWMIVAMTLPIFAQTDNSGIEAKVTEDHGTKEVQQENGTVQAIQNVTIRILEGEYENEEHNVEYVLSENIDNQNAKDALQEDNKVRVIIQEQDGEVSAISIQEIIENQPIFIILLVFFVLVLLIGRKKAIKPIAICVLTVLAIYFMFVVSTSKGWNMLLMAAITAFVVNVMLSIVLNGIGGKASIVVISSMLGVMICGISAFFYFKWTQLSGELFNTSIFQFPFNIKELLCSGVILTSGGMCLYISSILANDLEEIKKEDKHIPWKHLFKMGLDKGMDIFTNSIYLPIFLYLCSAITLMAFSRTIYNETIAVIFAYFIHVGIGAIVTVPIISFLYPFLNRNKMFFKTRSDNIIEGQRSLKL